MEGEEFTWTELEKFLLGPNKAEKILVFLPNRHVVDDFERPLDFFQTVFNRGQKTSVAQVHEEDVFGVEAQEAFSAEDLGIAQIQEWRRRL